MEAERSNAGGESHEEFGVMHWEAWAPTILTLIGVVFGSGQISGRIKGQEKTLARHDAALNEHDDRLSGHDVAIAKAEAWRAGYSAGEGAHKAR